MIKKAKVYLKGAYGPGNIGDDVLLVAMINILKRKFRASDIVIGVEHPESAIKLDPSVRWDYYKVPYSVDILVYGGGGQFFDFNSADNSIKIDKTKRIINGLSKQKGLLDILGRLYVKLKGGADDLIVYKKAYAYCIGLGPFERNGYGTERTKKYISNSSFTTVRDATSYKNFLEIGGSEKNIRLFSDPSFNLKNWVKIEPSSSDTVQTEGYYTYIVRHWPYSEVGNLAILNMITHAKKMLVRGERVKLVALDAAKDKEIIEMYPDFDWEIYDYKDISCHGFIQKLVENSLVIISARAHGAWLPVILGKPVIIVEIENKLREVHLSLPSSTLLSSGDNLDEVIDDYLAGYERLSEGVKGDIEQGLSEAILAEEFFLNWIDENV